MTKEIATRASLDANIIIYTPCHMKQSLDPKMYGIISELYETFTGTKVEHWLSVLYENIVLIGLCSPSIGYHINRIHNSFTEAHNE